MPDRCVSAFLRVLLFMSGSAAAGASTAAPPEPIRFNRDVRPILSDACFHCHGPAKQKAGLRLDQRESAVKPGASGDAAIVPGKPATSELVARILSKDETAVMPPPDSHKSLTTAQKDVLRRWIAEGAVYEPHWSFAELKKPAAPAAQTPSARHAIDAFVNSRLQKEGLTPAPEADRPTLVRRVAFAVTGLPPTPQEAEEFVRDTKPGAYERMVDRYLNSPRYGEEMARHWLDLARYGDTHGLHLDNERGTWVYRDWVVRAFNENKPFDRFTIEQLAGDLLPNPTNDQLVATGFNRCNVSTGEGGSIAAEWYFRNAIDRAATTAETWLGLTAGCAVCHDHKFDPFSQKDFYSLYAFFYSAAGPSLDGNKLLHEPFLKLTTPEQAKRIADLDKKIAELGKGQDAKLKALAYVDPVDAKEEATPAKKPDETASFKAWLNAKGGKNRGQLPREISAVFGAIAKSAGKPNAGQESQLRTYFLQNVCVSTKPEFAALQKEKEALTAERNKVDESIAGTMIFRDDPKPREAFVMLRGQYDKPGDKVLPGTPSALPPLKKEGRANRLDLAKWLVSGDNPLTARVYVNRLWQQLFGTGLVKTSADFGAQGEPPSHPELLDDLAVRFREGGWDVKRAVKHMLTSDAFRRSAKGTPESWTADPENRLYARGPRFRLDAEQVRDNALYAAGLLNLTVGGKGVKPYQPENIWEPVAYTGSNTRVYKPDTGAALYRRSLYTFYKRTAPPPFLTNFDAPNREQPCSRRDRSNTPLQALQLMNDVQHFEAARGLAERMLVEGGAIPAERIAFAYRVILSREPSAAERAIVEAELDAHLARFAKAPADAAKAIAHGETKPRTGTKPEVLAAYTLVANMLLNLDETLTRN